MLFAYAILIFSLVFLMLRIVLKDVRAQKFPRTDFFKNFDCS